MSSDNNQDESTVTDEAPDKNLIKTSIVVLFFSVVALGIALTIISILSAYRDGETSTSADYMEVARMARACAPAKEMIKQKASRKKQFDRADIDQILHYYQAWCGKDAPHGKHVLIRSLWPSERNTNGV